VEQNQIETPVRHLSSEWKKYGISIAHFSIGILITGLVYQISYYWYFSLPIKYFINLSEIALLVSNELFLFTGSAFSIGIFLIEYWLRRIEKRKQTSEAKEEITGKKVIKSLLETVARINIYCLPVILLLFLFLPIDKKIMLWYTGLTVLAIPTLSQVIAKRIYESLSVAQHYIFLLSTVLLGTTIILAGSYAYNTQKGKYNGTFIHLKDDRCYTSNDSLFFIGKTEKYIFLHNKKDTSNMIIDVDDIKTFILKSK
jgi:hypothetical protein